MSRKKQVSYGEMARMMEEMQERMKKEKERMAEVMAGALLTGDAAATLGDYSDADLRRIMGMVAADIGKYAARLDAEKQAKKDAKLPQETAQASLVAAPYPTQQNGGQPFQNGPGYVQQ